VSLARIKSCRAAVSKPRFHERKVCGDEIGACIVVERKTPFSFCYVWGHLVARYAFREKRWRAS